VSTQVSSWLNFTPLSFSPQLWLDASDTTTITESGGSVSQWNDKSGNGRDFVQATAGSQPSTGTITLNNKNVISFFSGRTLVSNAAASTWNFMHNGESNIIAMVWRTTSSNPNALMVMASTANIDANQRGFVLCYDDRSSVSRNDTMLYFVLRGGGTPSVNGVLSANDAFPAGIWGVTSTLIDPDATAAQRAFVYTNDKLVSAAETSITAPSTSDATATFTLGATASGLGFPATIYLAELIVVSGTNAIGTTRKQLDSYLRAKWSIY
jgi:hypothetical protein